MLPWQKQSTFAIPFGGMAGVLLSRSPVRCEIYNDFDKRLVNWWAVVRRDRAVFGEMVEAMPWSEAEYDWACSAVDDPELSDTDRALAFHTLALQSIAQNLVSMNWSATYNVGPTLGRWRSERVEILAERFWNIQLFCRPAEVILERLAIVDNAVIYADPPYYTRNTSAYAVCEVNVNTLSELFIAQQGKVAISGMGDEWDHLDWHRTEQEFEVTPGPVEKKRKRKPLIEVLWTNYDTQSIHSDSRLL